jgi:hypothetical protein
LEDGLVGRLFGVVGSGLGQDVESEVAAGFGPFVVLFGQDDADESDDGCPVGEDADDVGAASDFAVEAFVGLFDARTPRLAYEAAEELAAPLSPGASEAGAR